MNPRQRNALERRLRLLTHAALRTRILALLEAVESVEYAWDQERDLALAVRALLAEASTWTREGDA